jgi:tetratricopeptide (TPR) repeat protein
MNKVELQDSVSAKRAMRTFLNKIVLMANVLLCVIHAAHAIELGIPHLSDFLQESTTVDGRETGRKEVAPKHQRAVVARRGVEQRIQLAGLLMKDNRFPEAIAAYKEVLALEPNNENIEVDLANVYRLVHNDEQARKTLIIARRQHPQSVAVLIAAGNLEMDLQKYDAALEAFRTALKVAPANSDARNLMATAYLKKGDSERALREFDRVLQQYPANGLARFLRAGIYADHGENEKALDDAEKVVAAKPEYLPARILYAKILLRLKDCQHAAEILHPPEQPLVLDGDGLFLLASAYDCAGQKELADSARTKFAAVSRMEHEKSENRVQSLHLVEQAHALALQNKLSEAQELLKQALEKNSENAFAYSQQAKVYFSAQQARAARAAIDKAIQIQPHQPDFLFVRGVIEAAQGDLDGALASFQAVTFVNPVEADAYYEIGKIWMQKSDRSRALTAFRRAAELSPGDSDYRQAVRSASGARP